MDRTEWEQKNFDIVEEDRLKKQDAIQACLNGMWRERLDGCPHRHEVRDSVDICDANEMRPCTGNHRRMARGPGEVEK